jgi:hypothetical protein
LASPLCRRILLLRWQNPLSWLTDYLQIHDYPDAFEKEVHPTPPEQGAAGRRGHY